MIVLKKISPMFMGIITTADVHEDDSISKSGIIDGKTKKGSLKEYQTILAIGQSVTHLKVGDLVCVNPANYAVKKFSKDTTREMVESYNPVVQYNFNFLELNGNLVLKLTDRDIDFIVDEFEEIPDVIEDIPSKSTTKPGLILPPNKLILPN